jgi:tetratricopeptide (TPR) repeat protein
LVVESFLLWLQAWLGLARAAEAMKDLTEASSAYDKAIETSNAQSSLPASIGKAILLMNVKNFAQSEAILLDLVKTRPDVYAAHFNLGLVYTYQHNYKRAAHAFRAAVVLRHCNHENINIKSSCASDFRFFCSVLFQITPK